MAAGEKIRSVTVDRLSYLVISLGLLVALLPIAYLGLPGGEFHELTMPVLIMQSTGLVIGIGVICIGYFSKRSGKVLPALATGSFVVGLVVAGFVAAIIEMSGNFLIPIWLSILLVLIIGIIAVLSSVFIVRNMPE